jgi:hypothetical protein
MKQRHTQPMAPEAKVEKTTDPGITPRPPTADHDDERPSQTRRRRAADTEPMAPPGLDDDLDDLANAALATPAIPERPDSDGARVARYAAEGKPMKAVAVTVPTGEVLVEPTNEPTSTPEATPDGPMVSRRDVVTGPSSRAVEAARAEAERRRTRNALVLAALVIFGIVAVVVLIATATRDPKVPEAAPNAAQRPRNVAGDGGPGRHATEAPLAAPASAPSDGDDDRGPAAGEGHARPEGAGAERGHLRVDGEAHGGAPLPRPTPTPARAPPRSHRTSRTTSTERGVPHTSR